LNADSGLATLTAVGVWHDRPVEAPVPLAVQLYSLRNEAAADLRAVLERVAGIGYLGVEFAGLHGNPPRVVRGWLADLGLTAVSAHAKVRESGDEADRLLDELAEVGLSTVVVPWAPPERFSTIAGVASVAADLDIAQRSAAARGMSLGYHNHQFELSSTADGRSALAHLFELAGPDVFAQVDVYWVAVGGADPARVVADLGGRVRLLHIKDGPADGTTSPNTAVGAGVLDFRSIVAASPDVAWHIVELDACASDMTEALAQSYRWLTERGLSGGRE
jgi:sugar phosphate isomerase/epimerase